MIDIVKDFKDKAESLGYVFDYGTKAMNNLLGSSGPADEVYLLLSSPMNWKRDPSLYGALGKQTLKSSFLFVVKSDLDQVIYRQRDANEDGGKYNKNIVPLMPKLDAFKVKIDCAEYEVEAWEAIDAYNLLDTNTDGFLVTFTLKEV